MTFGSSQQIEPSRTLGLLSISVENGPASHSDHGGRQLNQLPRQTHDKNSQPHHIKTDVEQCPQHQRREVHVPRHQEFLLDCPPRLFQIHEDAAISLPILDKGAIQFGQAHKERICVSRNAVRRMGPSPSRHTG